MGGSSPPGGAASGVAAPGGGPQPLDASRGRVVAWTVGVLVIVGGVVVTLDLVFGPRPDATLQRTSGAPDAEAIRWAQTETPEMQIDVSTLRPFEPFGEWQVWSAVNAFGAPCLLAFESNRFGLTAFPSREICSSRRGRTIPRTVARSTSRIGATQSTSSTIPRRRGTDG